MAAGFSGEVQIPDPLYSSHVTLDTLLPLSEVQFLHVSNGDKNSGCCIKCALNEKVSVAFEESLAHTKCLVAPQGCGGRDFQVLFSPKGREPAIPTCVITPPPPPNKMTLPHFPFCLFYRDRSESWSRVIIGQKNIYYFAILYYFKKHSGTVSNFYTDKSLSLSLGLRSHRMVQQAESPGKRHLKAQEDREADRWGQEREQLRNRGGFLRKMGTKGGLCRAKSSFMPFKAQNQRNRSALQANSPCLLLCLKKVPLQGPQPPVKEPPAQLPNSSIGGGWNAEF